MNNETLTINLKTIAHLKRETTEVSLYIMSLYVRVDANIVIVILILGVNGP